MLDILICLLPREAWAPLLVLAGLLIIIGLRKAGFNIVGAVILLALLGPFFVALIDSLPPELFFLLMVFFAFMVFRMVFGRRVTENVLTSLIMGVLKAPFKFLGWLSRRPVRRM